MIQFNLLPDVKLEYIKTNRLKRSVTLISVFVAAAAIFIFVLLLVSVDVVQKHHLNDLNTQITSATTQLKAKSNLNQVLTVQDEVNALPALYNQNPVVSRLPSYLYELTPASASISNLEVNYTTDVVTITGAADTLATVNQYVDTLKLSSYQTTPNVSPKNAFSNVVLSSFTYSTSSGAAYTITASFDPAIFNAVYPNVTLNVPTTTSTYSTSGQSNALFQSTTSNSSSQ